MPEVALSSPQYHSNYSVTPPGPCLFQMTSPHDLLAETKDWRSGRSEREISKAMASLPLQYSTVIMFHSNSCTVARHAGLWCTLTSVPGSHYHPRRTVETKQQPGLVQLKRASKQASIHPSGTAAGVLWYILRFEPPGHPDVCELATASHSLSSPAASPNTDDDRHPGALCVASRRSRPRRAAVHIRPRHLCPQQRARTGTHWSDVAVVESCCC